MLHLIWSTCGIQLNQACETYKQKSAHRTGSINDVNGIKESKVSMMYEVSVSLPDR